MLTASADSSTGLIVTDHEGKLIKAEPSAATMDK